MTESYIAGVAAISKNIAKHPLGADGVVDLSQTEFFVGVRTTTPSVPYSEASQYFLSGTATPPGQEGSSRTCGCTHLTPKSRRFLGLFVAFSANSLKIQEP